MGDEVICLAYQIPGEPADANISTKTLAIGSDEFRGVVQNSDKSAWLQACVEVFSHSHQSWCVGKITEIKDDTASIVFFYPNDPPDAVPVCKVLPLSDMNVRLQGIDAALASV